MMKKLTRDDFDKATGVICPTCKQETMRIIDGRCPRCNDLIKKEEAERMEAKSMRRYYRRALNEGTISLQQMKENRLGDK